MKTTEIENNDEKSQSNTEMIETLHSPFYMTWAVLKPVFKLSDELERQNNDI